MFLSDNMNFPTNTYSADDAKNQAFERAEAPTDPFHILIYTDGACSGNPGPGGWGALLVNYGREIQELSGFNGATTNNRMELSGVIQGLIQASLWKNEPQKMKISIISDSQYVIKGMTEWHVRWQANGWRTSQKKPVENKDLWQDLLHAVQPFKEVSWHWVRGHSGHAGNEYVDTLAQRALANGLNQQRQNQKGREVF